MSSPYPYPYTYAPAPPRLPSHPRATTSMVLGIIGVAGFFILLVPVIVSPLAWYFGAVAEREAEREPMRYRSASEAKTGLILGIIGTMILGVALLLLFVTCALIVIGANYDSGYGS